MLEGGYLDAAWIGAEHMLTGYDHLLFLFGVLFFLRRPIDIVKFVTAFTVGHTITLLGGTLAGIRIDPYLIDAVIALTVIYKAVENLDGFRRWFGVQQPSLLWMVFAFGLVHGLGLATRLQELTLARDEDLVGKILSFNVGVELAQIAALAVMGAVLHLWRQVRGWTAFATACNWTLIAAGLLLFALQIHGYLTQPTAGAPFARAAAAHTPSKDSSHDPFFTGAPSTAHAPQAARHARAKCAMRLDCTGRQRSCPGAAADHAASHA